MDGKTTRTIANEDGERQLPTVVAFTDVEVLVGSLAKQQASSNPRKTIFQFQTLLGQKMPVDHPLAIAHPSDPTLPAFEVGENEFKTVVEITSIYLSKVKATAESITGKTVDGCVVSTPPHFDKAAYQDLLKAAEMAGMGQVYTVKEPIAAMLPYDLTGEVLVLDLGGHQFNLTHVSVFDGIYVIKESMEDFELGGLQFDKVLFDFVKQDFYRKTKCDLTENRRSIQKLMVACEKAKKTLTRQDTTPLAVESLFDGMDYNGSILRGRFEMLSEPLFQRCKEEILKLSHSSMIKSVVLSGGASRIPRFQSLVQSILPGATLYSSIEPDEVISLGCAKQAENIMENQEDYDTDTINKLTKAKSISKPLGIAKSDGSLMPLVHKGAVLPIHKTLLIPTSEQKAVYVALYEGESCKDGKCLVELVLDELSADQEQQVEITLIIESDGKSNLNVVEKKSGKKLKVKF